MLTWVLHNGNPTPHNSNLGENWKKKRNNPVQNLHGSFCFWREQQVLTTICITRQSRAQDAPTVPPNAPTVPPNASVKASFAQMLVLSYVILNFPRFNQHLNSLEKKPEEIWKGFTSCKLLCSACAATSLPCNGSLVSPSNFSRCLHLVIHHQDITNVKQKYSLKAISGGCHAPASYKSSKLTLFLHKFNYSQLRPERPCHYQLWKSSCASGKLSDF